MNQSAELENLISRWYEDLSRGNTATIDRLFPSHGTGFLYIGTDPNEWWRDAAEIKREYQEIAKSGRVKIKVLNIEGYREGDVGWVISKVNYRLPKGNEITMRQTYILHMEQGDWKVVHVHASSGVPNDEFGA